MCGSFDGGGDCKNIMEVFISPGFAHIGSTIFQYLDNQSLCQSRLVCSSWAWFIVSERFWHKRIIQLGKKSRFCQSDEWCQVFDSFGDTNKDLSEILQHFFSYVLDEVRKILKNATKNISEIHK